MTLDRPSKTSSISKRKRHTTSSSTSTTKIKAPSIFDTVATLEQEDDNVLQLHGHNSNHHHDNDMNNYKQKQRAAAVQAQTNIYSRLIECRILLQRSMTTISQQQHQDDATSLHNTKEQEERKEDKSYDNVINQCNSILIKLLEGRKLLSQTSNVMIDDSVDYQSLVNQSGTSDSNSNSILNTHIRNEYDQYRTVWKDVLNRRHYDLQLHSGVLTNKKTKFNIIDTSFWQQVQSTFQHEIIRKQQQQQGQLHNNVNDPSQDNHYQNHSYVLFDDTKIYQQMLKDFVDATTSDQSQTNSNNSILQQRKMLQHHHKNKTQQQKIMIDRKASKGRKVRYHTIDKLTNFTFPIQRRNFSISHASSTTAYDSNVFLDDDAWFRSLFGGSSGSSSNNKDTTMQEE
jgi:protein AATF/BFR2